MIDMELSDDLMTQLEIVNNTQKKPEVSSTIAKFDDTGTLHVKGYDEDGKPIQDMAFKKEYDWQRREKIRKYDVDLREEEEERLETVHKNNVLMTIGLFTLIGLLVVLTICSFIIISK